MKSIVEERKNGVIAAAGNSMISLICNEENTAKNVVFTDLAQRIVDRLNSEELSDVPMDEVQKIHLSDGETVEETLQRFSMSLEDNIQLNRVTQLPGGVLVYLHHPVKTLPPQLGVMLSFEGDVAAARAAAMQIAVMNPMFLTREDIPHDVLKNIKESLLAELKNDDASEDEVERMLEDRFLRFCRSNCFMEQECLQSGDGRNMAEELMLTGTFIYSYRRLAV